MTIVSEIMTKDVELASPEDTLRTAARLMTDIDAGVLPVGENDRLVGMITDRDIVVRGIAEGCNPETTTVRDIMTQELRYVFEDEEMEQVGRKMGEWQVRRLPVLSREKRLVGIISLGDLAMGAEEKEPAKEALEKISQPTGARSPQAEAAYAGSKPETGSAPES